MLDRSEIRKQLHQYVCHELLQRDDYPLRADEPMITSGLIDSFALARVAVFIEEAFEVYVPDTYLTVEKMDTLDLMADQVLAHAKD